MTKQWSKEEIYKAIIDWQMEAGEDFLDYFDGDFNVPNFMFWCLGKGYISQEKFNQWERAMADNDDWYADSMRGAVQDCQSYSVVHEADWTEEGQEKAYGILAEFIASSITYKNRLVDFLEENA